MDNQPASHRRLSFVLVEAAKQFDLGSEGVELLLGRSRSKSLARARQCAMAVMCDAYGMSQPEVGRLFEKDHTTVLHACRVVRRFPDYEQLLATVRAAFPGEGGRLRSSTGKGGFVDTLSTAGSVIHTPRIGPPASSSPNSSDT